MPGKTQPQAEMLKGTLDMMVLRTLVSGDAHGHTIAKVIEHTSENLLEVEQGSLYPALHRLENRKLLAASWKVSETGREAKFYLLTAAGRAALEAGTATWKQLADAVRLILRAGEEGA